MAAITPGNRLYLYQLFSREIGIGKQTMLTRYEEVLAADDIEPADLACESVREVMEALDDFVRLTTFKRGRIYATILERDDFEEMLSNPPEKAPQKKALGGPKSWKQRRASKTIRPAKPRPRNRVKPEPEPCEASDVSPSASSVAELPTAVLPAKGEVTVTPDAADVELPSQVLAETPHGGEDGDVAQTASLALDETAAPPANTDEAADAMASGDEAPHDLDAQPTVASPSPDGEEGTPSVDQNSLASDADAAEDDMDLTQEESPEPPRPREHDSEAMHSAPERVFPKRFADEVRCPSAQLSRLYAILPFDVDPMALLDEDWRVALSNDSYVFEGSVLTYPLRYLRTDDRPVEVTLRRGIADRAGRRWSLEEVHIGEAVGFEGLPYPDEGPWAHLSPTWRAPHEFVSPTREIAQYMHLGSWDRLLEELAELAQDEDWGKGRTVLRDYLGVTFHRLQAQHKIAVTEDGSRAAFDTGLLTEQGMRIFALLRRNEGPLPWDLEGFGTDCGNLDPQPATYVESLVDVTVAHDARVLVGRALRDAYGTRIEEAIACALRKTHRSFRLATPVYDPQTDELRLLVPLCLEDASRVSGALVLAAHKEAEIDYTACSVLPLEAAYACARVVSAAQPEWLT